MPGVFAIAFLTILANHVSAQTQPPACIPGHEWSYNDLHQTPCEITVALGGVCINTVLTLPPLVNPNDIYLGPNQGADANRCRCSSVYYSVLSACADCQNHNFLPWSKYKANCTAVYAQVFQDPIPSSTRVPHYAYLDVTIGDTFNVSAAMNAGGSESTAVPQSTGAVTSATASPTSTSNNSKSKAGPIAGGVVGGVVFLAILAGLIILILRRRKQSAPHPATYNSVVSPEPSMSHGNNSSIPASAAHGRIYDPNDPSTFPTNDLGTNYQPSFFQQQGPVTPTITGSGTVASMPTGPARPHYTGAPEL